ncbi:hypothetical protein [Halarcobacter bivalviorum]|uniref:Glycosyltransferase, family 1 n=1 Tax=Halarcobacter bivalviorum TaxID=663364 RepID=A0AAX2A6R7_9BACT|nr:hypothetical protein [Halarcobacter bivalviorum]AXH13453.1 hypothetical protein ABIV_2482 [Halarcobacter bivalviorum]RXK09949.1 hypothetical protein CRV05_06085 [Halarcobacter bivalviorum]
MKIGIFSPYSINPIHPRLELLYNTLSEVEEYDVDIISRDIKNIRLKTKINNFFTLGFYDLFSFSKIPKIFKYDIIYVQDMLYLWIVFFAKLCGKKVIYETLDNNVHLNYYHLAQRVTFFKRLPILLNIFSFLERMIVFNFTDKIIVNSDALNEYFKNKTEVIYYASPLEKMKQRNDSNKDIAFLYLGWFTPMKGSKEILDLVEKYPLYNFYIYGTISDRELRERVFSNKNIIHKMRMNSTELNLEIKKLLDKYYLLGFSLTKSINLSNAMQEINKDMDYMALGIPIIGNRRIPTKEKIEKGCGIYLENLEEILNYQNIRKKISEDSIKYYYKKYSISIYQNKILNIVKDIVNV